MARRFDSELLNLGLAESERFRTAWNMCPAGFEGLWGRNIVVKPITPSKYGKNKPKTRELNLR